MKHLKWVVAGICLGSGVLSGCSDAPAAPGGSNGGEGGESGDGGEGAQSSEGGEGGTGSTDGGAGGDGASGDGNSSGASNGGDGGASSGGEGGQSSGGQSNGGAGPGEPGPGIPAAGDVYCLTQVTNADQAFYYGYQSACTVLANVDGSAPDEDQLELMGSVCTTLYGGQVVDACPDDREPAAYCAGTDSIGLNMFAATKIVYQSDVTPDAAAVARNELAICGRFPGYDLDDAPLSATCTGTLTAEVDGMEQDFSEQFVCTFRSDGTKAVYLVRGSADGGTLDNRELTLRVGQDGEADPTYYEEVLQPPVAYLEGGTAAGAFGFTTPDTDLVFEAADYDVTGGGFTATFSIGQLSTSPTETTNVRVITNGSISIDFSAE